MSDVDLEPLASFEQLAARLVVTPTDTADIERAKSALEDASAEVRHEAGRTWTDDDGNLDQVPAIAKRITLRLAKAIYDNPYDYRSEQIGEYANQRRAGGMLTPEERAQLRSLAGNLVSVETEPTLQPSGTTGLFMDAYRRREASR